MTLKSICTEVLGQTGFPAVSTISPSNDPQAQQMFALANAELVFLSQQHRWPQLEVEYEFFTVPGQRVYSLPDDFHTMVSDTMFDADQYYRVKGSVSDEQFMSFRYSGWGDLARTRFKLLYGTDGGSSIALLGEPSTARRLVCMYKRNKYARSADNTIAERYTVDTDTSLIPEQLVKLGLSYRFRRAKGLDFSAELVEYNTAVSTALARLSGAGSIPVGYRYDGDWLPCGTVPENGFGQ